MVTSAAEADFDVVGIGNAIVDIIAPTPPSVAAEAGFAIGAMSLVDAAQADQVYARMAAGIEMSGGSVANSMAAIAALGGRAGFVGRVCDDQFGQVFVHDCRAAGVSFDNPPATSGSPTARCLVLVHPDAQRTMLTYLGASTELGPTDLDRARIEAAQITFLEGYLWDKPDAKAACREAAAIAHGARRMVALSLSDPFCCERWRADFRHLVEHEVDILVANEAEITSLYEAPDFDVALQAIRSRVEIAALTRGAKGAVIVRGEEVHVIDAARVPSVVDTTGAGDLFAAGFLHGVTQGMDLRASGRLGALCAGVIIQQYGPRAERPLAPLVAVAADGAAPLEVAAA